MNGMEGFFRVIPMPSLPYTGYFGWFLLVPAPSVALNSSNLIIYVVCACHK
jgi:hypothetical protein